MTGYRDFGRTYHLAMVHTPRAVPVDELAAVVGASELTCIRVPDPAAAVRGVVVHARDDPNPSPDLLVLCTDPSAGVPECVAVVVRESCLPDAAVRIPAETAVFAAPDNLRWSDIYDRVQWALGESFGRLAERDVFHLADALATALGGAVAIEDARRRVVAFSTIPGQQIDDVRRAGILDRQVPEHVERESWYATLWRTDGVVEYPAGPQSTARLATAVRVGGEPLGSIWVVGGRDALHADAEQILLRSVDTVAACLAHQDHFAARGREFRRQVLLELFDRARERNKSAGFELAGPSLLISVHRDAAAGDAELFNERLADVLSLHAHRHQGTGLAGVIDDRVYALLPATDRGRLEGLICPIVSRAETKSARICVSRVVDALDQLPAARRQADLLSRLAGDGPGPGQAGITYVEDETRQVLLAGLADVLRAADDLDTGAVATLAEHDREHGSEYIPTLRAWLEAGGDVPAAAARTFVHPNTFRYRMSRLRSLFGVELDDPDERLLLHLHLRMRDFD